MFNWAICKPRLCPHPSSSRISQPTKKTKTQQTRLNVVRPTPLPSSLPPPSLPYPRPTPNQDEHGHKKGMHVGGVASIGPAWTRGEIEAPAGEKDMGTWRAAVYTEEQQKRLGVDEFGHKKQ